MILILLSLLVVTGVIYYMNLKFYGPRKGKPVPGPGLLEVMYHHFNSDFRLNLHNTFTAWSKKYGDIYSMNFLQGRMYLVGNLDLIKKISAVDCLSGRPDGALFSDMYEDGDKHGITIADGKIWEEIRRFTTRQLKNVGWSQATLEPLIIEEVDDFIELLMADAKLGPVGDWRDRFIIPIINALWRISTGEKLLQNDVPLTKLISKTTRSVSDVLTNNSGGLFLFPWIRKLAPEWSGFNHCRKPFNELCAYFTEKIQAHRETYSELHTRDFIDAYLTEMKRNDEPGSAFYKEMGEKQLCGILADILLAGSDAPSVAMAWAILYLSEHMDVQEKMIHEIRTVVGDRAYCSLDYRPNMPYSEAVISELLRVSTFFPIGFGNCVMADADVDGYHFAKGEHIMFNVHWVHRNPEIWGDPENFRPERFIKDGKHRNHPALLPFFTGKRMCIGDKLALDQLFLFVTNLFRKCKFELAPESRGVGTNPEPGYFWFPKEFSAIVTAREME